MRKLTRKGILPAAAVAAALYYNCGAQVYCPTNPITPVQAIKIVGQLRKGMREKEVNRFIGTNRLFSGIAVGDNFGWGEDFRLTNNWWLVLEYSGDDWGMDGVSSLESAYISSNQTNIISVSLAKSSQENPIKKQAEETKANRQSR